MGGAVIVVVRGVVYIALAVVAGRRVTDRGVVGERKIWHLEWYLRWPVPYMPCHETF